MSTPQLEDGFVRIANELLEALLAAGLTANQWKVVLAIIRKTYGYSKKEDDLSASQIASICAMNRTHVTEVLNQLARMNIINKRPGVHGSIVSIQKDARRWAADEKPDDGTPKRIIVKTADKHYVYRVTLPATGEFYLGVRSCKCHPNQDRYVGSGNWISTVKKGDLVKEVIKIFDNRQEAERAEVEFIRQHAHNGLLRNSTHYCSSSALYSDLSKSCPTRTESVQGVQETDVDRTDSVQVDRTESVHTKDNLPKDNQQKTSSCAPPEKNDLNDETPAGQQGRAMTGSTSAADRFERFYAAYPRKRSRGTAEKEFKLLDPDDAMVDVMVAVIERMVASGEWSDPQFIPYPANWLSAKGWLDEHAPTMPQPSKRAAGAWWETEESMASMGRTFDPPVVALPGDSMASFKRRIQEAIDRGGQPAPAAQPTTYAPPIPARSSDTLTQEQKRERLAKLKRETGIRTAGELLQEQGGQPNAAGVRCT